MGQQQQMLYAPQIMHSEVMKYSAPHVQQQALTYAPQTMQQQAVSHQPSPVTYTASAVQQPAAPQAVVKQEIAGWQICEDHMGEYYVYTLTGQSFDQPPAALLQVLQQAGF